MLFGPLSFSQQNTPVLDTIHHGGGDPKGWECHPLLRNKSKQMYFSPHRTKKIFLKRLHFLYSFFVRDRSGILELTLSTVNLFTVKLESYSETGKIFPPSTRGLCTYLTKTIYPPPHPTIHQYLLHQALSSLLSWLLLYLFNLYNYVQFILSLSHFPLYILYSPNDIS